MRVLIVEDDPIIAQSIRRGLRQESFAVDICHDGEDGYHTAMSETYDIIILDVLLPGMNGMEIASALRTGGVHARILMLSAKDQTADKINGLNAGVDDYMVKPFSFGELLARIQALLRRPEDVKSTVLEAGSLQLDPTTHAVTRNGTAITLTSKEFAILEYLLRNKGTVLSKNSIVTHVWDFDADILPHTVEAFMAMLRKKIDKPFPGPAIIQTVRGFGYTISSSL